MPIAILSVIAIIAVLRLWVLPLNNSYWLDESLIVWIVRDSMADALSRASASPQSMLYSALAWVVHRLGNSEIVLRLPSLGATIGAVFVYYRIGTEFLDREAGLVFAGLYITLGDVAVQAVSARPYSLALLGEAAALLFLLRWSRSGKTSHILLWAACSAVASHFHYFFALAMPLELLFAVWWVRKGTKGTGVQLLLYVAACGVLLTPALPQLAMLAREAASLSIPAPPTPLVVFTSIVPGYMLCGSLCILIASRLSGDRLGWKRSHTADIPLLGALLLLPVLGFAVLGILTDLRLFDPRYLLPSVPGLVLLWGWVVRGMDNTVRGMSVAAALVFFLVFGGREAPRFTLVPDYGHQDWRSADHSLDPSSALLLYSSLVETQRMDWLRNPDRWGYLMAPVLVYSPGLSPQNAFALPYSAGSTEQAYVDSLLDGPLRQRTTITFIGRDVFWGYLWESWLANRLQSAGYNEMRASRYGTIAVRVYGRVSARSAR